MSKIHVILVVLSMYFLNGANFESNLFSNKKYTHLSFHFRYFIIHKLNVQKWGKIKKMIEEIFLKLILNIVNFWFVKVHFSRYKFMPSM